MRPHAAAVFLAFMLLPACASQHWVQDGKTPDDAAAALVVCEQYATPKPDPMYAYRTFPDEHEVARCMGERGYRLVPQ